MDKNVSKSMYLSDETLGMTGDIGGAIDWIGGDVVVTQTGLMVAFG